MGLLLLRGIQAGLLLALLVGPLLVLLIQLSIRRGTMASFAAALGIWTSDFILLLVTHYGLGGMSELLREAYFAQLVGSLGGLMLIVIGAFMWFRRPINLDGKRPLPRRMGLARAFAQGFAVNTFNPFTFFFWSAFTVTQVHEPALSEPQAFAIYAGIFGTIILTDSAKVLGARKLRSLLRPEMLLRVQRIGALALGVFGLALVARVWW